MFLKHACSTVVLGALLFAVPLATQAQDGDEGEEVVTRLKRHGGLSGGAANKLAKQVSKSMNRSADMTNAPNDPLRVRVSMALSGAPQPGDAMSTAKVRLRLYAGLTSWALDSLFRPSPGGIASCTRDFKLSTKECTALLAAGGQMSTGEVAAAASGAGGSAPVAQAPMAAAPVASAAPAGGSRFGRYSSGFSGGAAPAQPAQPVMHASAAPPPSGRFGANGAPAARPTPVAAAPAPQAGSSTKDAYAARRAAYLEKQRAKLNKPAPGAPVESVAAGEPEEVAAAPVAAAPAAAKPAAGAKAAAPAEAPAAAAEPEKPTLEADFLDGLLADPLGKK